MSCWQTIITNQECKIQLLFVGGGVVLSLEGHKLWWMITKSGRIIMVGIYLSIPLNNKWDKVLELASS